MKSVMVSKFLRALRDRYHPLWILRRSWIYPWLDRICNFTIFCDLDGVAFPVALRSLRDFSWVVSSETLEPDTRRFLEKLLKQTGVSIFWDIGANIGYFA